jgi:hypothetical protein
MNAALPVPLSAHELQEAVRQRRRVNPSRLNRILRLDDRRALVEVQAHTRWQAIADRLRPADERVQGLLAARATVAASIARNGAGPDGRPMVTHVESLTMVTPDGHLRRVDRLTSGGLFSLALGGQALFGTVYSATLRIQSLLRAIDEPEPSATLTPGVPSTPARRLRLLVPPDAVDAFVADAQGRCAAWRTAVEGVQARRTRCEDETFLRWAQREYAEVTLWLTRRATIGGAVRGVQLLRELIDAAIARGGTFPIACTPEATREQTEACYPQLSAFLAEQRRFDPAGALENRWLRHQRALLCGEVCEIRWDREA